MKKNGKHTRMLKKIPFCPVLLCAISAFLTNIFIEALGRASITSLLSYIAKSPLAFLYNTLIIMFTLSLSLLFKRKIFVISLISVIWVILGIINRMVLVLRDVPLTASDFSSIRSAFRLSGLYVSVSDIAIVIFAVMVFTAAIVAVWRKSPKFITSPSKAIFSIAAIFILCAIMGFNMKAVSPEVTNLAEAYEEYGFVYCFSSSVFNQGIDEPDDYSEESVLDTVSLIENSGDTSVSLSDIKPNIIFVQLESFFDVKDIKGITYSEDPVSNFTKLKAEYPSGRLRVSSIGGGTANTEFEVMTGLQLDYFGTGEYPYQTVLRNVCCETVMRNLAGYGYYSTAIHNYTSSFYGRRDVFRKLGFDRFVSEEYMDLNDYNQLGWAKDSQLLPVIEKALAVTEGPDFVYTISVQAHGKYPDVLPDCRYDITADTSDKVLCPQLEYYISQIHEDDEFIGDLINYYGAYDEPVVIVFYGDHLPMFGLEADDLESGDLYSTEYVIWSNFGLEADDKDMEAYMLSSYVTGFFGMENGIVDKLNSRLSDDEKFFEYSELLAYDMLYGEKYSFGGKELEEVDTEMGFGDIETIGCSYENGTLTVKGSGYNACSRISVEGSIRNDTEFVDSETLVLRNFVINDEVSVSVSQVSDDGVVLTSTDAVTAG